MFMNPIDSTVIHFFNGFAHRSFVFDSLVVRISNSNLVKGGIMMALFWWAWFRPDSASSKKREMLVTGPVAAAFAMIVARTLPLVLPFRVRPMHNPLLNFQLPYAMDPSTLISWSSFPSDHAVLYFCLAITIWYASKPLGAVALCHALFVICLPRIYIGAHYPTDILCGALLGAAIASLALNNQLRRVVSRPGLFWLQNHPQSFCAFLFLFCFEVSEQFDSVRHLAVLSITLFHAGTFQAMR
jgi:undecaprenyl-diphosphatase